MNMVTSNNLSGLMRRFSRGYRGALLIENKDTKEVHIIEENLEKLEKSIQTLDCETVSIVSVIGPYRTGKSFLLDLLLRYLKFQERKTTSGVSGSPQVRRDRLEGSWIEAGGDITEGRVKDDKTGFHWRPGMDKCTEGIWVWSIPYTISVRKSKSDNSEGKRHSHGDKGSGKSPQMEKRLILLMDTQGAWDSSMTREQSATIFGITTALSSRLIYNIPNRLQKDQLENLEFFLNVARHAVQGDVKNIEDPNGTGLSGFSTDLKKKETNGDVCSTSEKGPVEKLAPLQKLDLLVRDWANFDEPLNLEQVSTQRKQHLDQHLSPESIGDADVSKNLLSMYEEVNCWLLPHPGFAIQKSSWDGNLKDMSQDFKLLLKQYVEDIFSTATLAPKRMLSSSPDKSLLLRPQSFGVVMRALVNAFRTSMPEVSSLSDAIGKSCNLVTRDNILKSLRHDLDSLIGAEQSGGIKPEIFTTRSAAFVASAISNFRTNSFGSDECVRVVLDSLHQEVDHLLKFFETENRRRLESGLVVLSVIILLCLVMYVADKTTDFTCDWYSETCVTISYHLFTCYTGLLTLVGVKIFFLYKEKGYILTTIAVTEMWKMVICKALKVS